MQRKWAGELCGGGSGKYHDWLRDTSGTSRSHSAGLPLATMKVALVLAFCVLVASAAAFTRPKPARWAGELSAANEVYLFA